MAKDFKPKIVSANDLFEGDVVYLDPGHGWTRDLGEAAVASTEEQADALIRAAAQPGEVVGPYLLEVDLGPDGHPQPQHFREKFRDLGPSNRTDLGRQAGNPPLTQASHGGL